MEARGRRAPVALAFAAAGLASAWSPLAATFGLVTSLGAAVLAVRARRGARPRLAALALVVALCGVGLSAWTIWRATSGPASAGAPADGLGPRQVEKQLDDAAAATRAARQRASGELEQLPKPTPSN